MTVMKQLNLYKCDAHVKPLKSTNEVRGQRFFPISFRFASSSSACLFVIGEDGAIIQSRLK